MRRLRSYFHIPALVVAAIAACLALTSVAALAATSEPGITPGYQRVASLPTLQQENINAVARELVSGHRC